MFKLAIKNLVSVFTLPAALTLTFSTVLASASTTSHPSQSKLNYVASVSIEQLRQYCLKTYTLIYQVDCNTKMALDVYSGFQDNVCRYYYAKPDDIHKIYATASALTSNGIKIDCGYFSPQAQNPRQPYITLQEEESYCSKVFPNHNCVSNKYYQEKDNLDNLLQAKIQSVGQGLCDAYHPATKIIFAENARYCLKNDNVTKKSGDFNGDSIDDVLLYENGSIKLFLRKKNTTTFAIPFMETEVKDIGSLPLTLGWKPVAAGRFDSDNISDILWRNDVTGENHIWIMNNKAERQASRILPRILESTGWEITTTGDFNGDKFNDIFWRNWKTGENHIWLIDSQGNYASSRIQPVVNESDGWVIIGSGDYNGDKRSEVLWRRVKGGINIDTIWRFDQSANYVGSNDQKLTMAALNGWSYALSTDLTGDGRDDLIWQNTITGDTRMWSYGNSLASPVAYNNLPNFKATSYNQFLSAGDYNGDGKKDILMIKTSPNVTSFYALQFEAGDYKNPMSDGITSFNLSFNNNKVYTGF